MRNHELGVRQVPSLQWLTSICKQLRLDTCIQFPPSWVATVIHKASQHMILILYFIFCHCPTTQRDAPLTYCAQQHQQQHRAVYETPNKKSVTICDTVLTYMNSSKCGKVVEYCQEIGYGIIVSQSYVVPVLAASLG